MAVQNIPQSDPQVTPQALIAHFPMTQLDHWFSMARAPVTRMKAYLESCVGPTPDAEEMRELYLDVLRDCEHLLQASLSPTMREQLACEDAALSAAVDAQRTKKVGIRRKAAPAQMAAD